MIWLILGYVYLCIHRPFEIWPALGDMRIELVYFTTMCAVWFAAPKRLRSPALLMAVGGMATAFLLSWLLSPWAERAEPVVKNFALVVVFALIMATALRDEKQVYRVLTMFLVVMGLYMLHSVWEYKNGRHTYRMSIARLIGVDLTLGDPNSFGASIVYSLPFLTFFWHHYGRGAKRIVLCGGYLLLSVGCVLLTGSRSSLLGVVLWGVTLLLQTRQKLLAVMGLGVLACASWFVLPESLQNRFETIIDPSKGPANAQESGQGRIEGYVTGLKLWSEYPVSGCGPLAWRPASGSKIESHTLYGQVMGEMGTAGVLAFGALVSALGLNLRKVAKLTKPGTGVVEDRSLFHLARAMQVSLFLLLFEGLFGHNLYRYNWSWYCAFTAVALGVCKARLAMPSPSEDDEFDDEDDGDEATEWHYSMASTAA
ncbi:MAG: O-antigen ligase family protein [Gemmataceae bacterium]